MPRTEQLVVALLKNLAKEFAVPDNPLPFDRAIKQVRERVGEIPYTDTRVAATVWLLKRLTTQDPLITTVINTLNHDSLKEGKLSQIQVSKTINGLLAGTPQSRNDIFKKAGNGDRLKIHSTVLKQIEK